MQNHTPVPRLTDTVVDNLNELLLFKFQF